MNVVGWSGRALVVGLKVKVSPNVVTVVGAVRVRGTVNVLFPMMRLPELLITTWPSGSVNVTGPDSDCTGVDKASDVEVMADRLMLEFDAGVVEKEVLRADVEVVKTLSSEDNNEVCVRLEENGEPGVEELEFCDVNGKEVHNPGRLAVKVNHSVSIWVSTTKIGSVTGGGWLHPSA